MLEHLNRQNYLKVVLSIALPLSLQVLFQSSLGIIDQIMVGMLGETVISGIGLGGKIPTVFFFTSGAFTVGASILMSQFYGRKDRENVSRAFVLFSRWIAVVGIVFFLGGILFAESIISIYTPDPAVRAVGAVYLRIVAVGFLPSIVTGMVGSLFRSLGKVKLPTYASFAGVFLNTFLNWVLIFGKFGLPAMGAAGAAIATTATRFLECAILVAFFLAHQKKPAEAFDLKPGIGSTFRLNAFRITLPIFLSELLWSLGENAYGIIYGHIGTAETAAMVSIGPVVMLTIGFFAGVSQAASVTTGNRLGAGEPDFALFLGTRTWLIGMVGAIAFGILVIVAAPFYPRIYNVGEATRATMSAILVAYALVLWIKVSNMILGGVLKAGGKTKYVFYMDLVGTWAIGVPLGAVTAFVLDWPIQYVYLAIALEELVRLVIGVVLLRSRKWIRTIAA